MPCLTPAIGRFLLTNRLIKAFSIDLNWDLFWRPASPGLYAHADPIAQVRWCSELGANVMQTFCVSYNGYAWFPSNIAPITPGLKGNFLQEQVEEGQRLNITVMGYFCLGANTFWAIQRPENEWHSINGGGHPQNNWIPFSERYLDYFCACVQDALRKTDISGFMIDWFQVQRGSVWLDIEKQMWQELLDEKFPACGRPSAEAEIEFKRRQIERAWLRIKHAVQDVRPAILWTNHPFRQIDDPIWNGHRLLKEADWILNESPQMDLLEWLQKQIGPHTQLIQNFCGWVDHSAENWKTLDISRFGLYGFSAVNPATCLPWTSAEIDNYRRPVMLPAVLERLYTDARNIEILRKAYHQLG